MENRGCKNKVIKNLIILILTALVTIITTSYADQDTISIFPLNNYDQTITHWIKSTDTDYQKPLISSSMQQQRLKEFYNHYFSTSGNNPSPWNPTYIKQILQQTPPNDLLTQEKNLISTYSNDNKSAKDITYGENFRPYDSQWINAITDNMKLAQFNAPIHYQNNGRAIALTNLDARLLPTSDPNFYSYKLPGQGYPFDNLQYSALWAGTPLYIIGQTKDRAWSLVLTPEFIEWVKTDGIARVDENFIDRWQAAAKKQMAAIMQTQTNIFDSKKNFRFSAYVGSVFPVTGKSAANLRIMIPVIDNNGNAKIDYATLTNTQAVIIPIAATPGNFARIMQTLQLRPYGWGGIYFYNDCSAELKSLYTPFGIWLPRASSAQPSAGKLVDMSSANTDDRINYVIKNGHKLMTIIYIGGHVFMYIGNYVNPNSPDHQLMAMTYQELWGLSPADHSRRAVIGESVFFPLLKQYPEDNSLASLASKKYFQISFLDAIPDQSKKTTTVNIADLVNP